MSKFGKELWHELLCVAKRTESDFSTFLEKINVTVFESASWYFEDAGFEGVTGGDEYWVLAVHAIYSESRSPLVSFWNKARNRLSGHVRYELISTDNSKRNWLEEVLSEIVARDADLTSPTPIIDGRLTETTNRRRQMSDDSR